MAIIVTTNAIIKEFRSSFTARENISVLADFPMAVTALCDNGIPNSIANIAMNHCSKVTIESTAAVFGFALNKTEFAAGE